MTKHIVWALAALLFTGSVQAEEKLTLSFTAKKCASFQGEYSAKGFKGEVDGRIDAKCELENGVGAVCTLTFIDKAGNVIKTASFKGNFQMARHGDAIDTIVEVLAPGAPAVHAQLFCTDTHCPNLRFFNSDTEKGLACVSAAPVAKKPEFQTGNSTFDL